MPGNISLFLFLAVTLDLNVVTEDEPEISVVRVHPFTISS